MLSEIVHRAVAWAARRYQNHTGKQLKKYGLLYEDTFIETPQVMQAISRLPADVRIARDRRIQRALDLSTKQKELPEEFQPKDPFHSYLGPYLNQSNRDILERSVKNWF